MVTFLRKAFEALEDIKQSITGKLEDKKFTRFLAKEFVQHENGNAAVINKLADAAPARPHPFSLASPYTSWVSLTNRQFTGRHLPEAPQNYTDFLRNNVKVDKVTALFKRAEMKKCSRSNAMFMSFAQWFTDGFLRTDPTDSRKNTSNHEIDLCQIYGLREEITDILRTKEGGRLKTQLLDTPNGEEEFPPYLLDASFNIKQEFYWKDQIISRPLHILTPSDSHAISDLLSDEEKKERTQKLFAMGTDRSNSTLGYAMLNTLFIREHNRIASELEKNYSAWDDERLFQTTRNILIVILIKIVVEDYIRHISGLPLTADPTIGYDKKWYRTNRMTLEFNLLYRWHSLARTDYILQDSQYSWQDLMYNNNLLTKYGIGALFESFSKQSAGQIGLYNTPDYLHPIEKRNIELSRNHKLRSYTDYQRCFKQNVAEDFEDITQDIEIQKELESLYGTVDKVEWYVGLYAEDKNPHGIMGNLQTVMVANDAFSQALTNPLLAEAVYNEQTFSKKGMDIIYNTRTLDDILKRNIDTAHSCSMGI